MDETKIPSGGPAPEIHMPVAQEQARPSHEDEVEVLRARVSVLEGELLDKRNQLKARVVELARAQAIADESIRRASRAEALAGELYASTSWGVTAPLRRAMDWVRVQKRRTSVLASAVKPSGRDERKRIKNALLRRFGAMEAETAAPSNSIAFHEWADEFDTLSDDDLDLITRHAKEGNLPKLTVLWRVASRTQLDQAYASLKSQLHGAWRAVFIGAGLSTHGSAAAGDPRVKFCESASQMAKLLPDGEQLLVVDRPGALREHAIYVFAAESRSPQAVLFCDEDSISRGVRSAPRFAPNYSPEFSAIGSVLLMPADWPTEALMQWAAGNSTLPELALAGGAARQTPRRIPMILFHNAQVPGSGRNSPASEEDEYLRGNPSVPKFSIIIPTRDRLDLLEPCVLSILEKTDYPKESIEIVVVDNGSVEPETLEFLSRMEGQGSLQVLRDPQKFNYSRLNNNATRTSSGEILAFVNNDVVIIDPLWLRRLAFHAIKRDVGAVGCKLLYPDGTVQHGGVILGIQGVAAHAHHNLAADAPGYMGLARATHGISAVTGACLAMRRQVFEQVGGFDEELEVAFNDVLLCLGAMRSGYRNVYIGKPLMIHYESKSRGYDDTEAKKAVFLREARYARAQYPELFKADPYYNENLSLEKPYELAIPPRVERPWHQHRRQSTKPLRILMLSVTHQVGHGVAVVVDLQARHLISRGHAVLIAGPRKVNDFEYEGCLRLEINDPREAAIAAYKHGVDCVVMHTPPFFSTARWLGNNVKSIAYDYGEPDPYFFSDALARRAQVQEKNLCIEMADAVYAISDSVKAEAMNERMGVIPLANAHLAHWTSSSETIRIEKRQALGLADRHVILNVCRFHEGERRYKGIDEYVKLRNSLISTAPSLAAKCVFLLAGKGNEQDVREMEAEGLRVFANVSDTELAELYCAADVYANFSRWEGYNLGIGQALAFGLPVVASDIPAHRAFGIFVSNDTGAAAKELAKILKEPSVSRVPRVKEWDASLDIFANAIEHLCSNNSSH